MVAPVPQPAKLAIVLKAVELVTEGTAAVPVLEVATDLGLLEVVALVMAHLLI
jgi:hypothetical protein